ncbi:MAG TPA: hypothetical protein VHO69_03495 [Phototrophicaceae bacterium]|nr:hypothetical protein [Phototrophicaceae bacterium]
MRLTQTQCRLMKWGIEQGYIARTIPGRQARPPVLRRAFNQATIRRLVAAGYIRYTPAKIYVTGAGRKALRREVLDD